MVQTIGAVCVLVPSYDAGIAFFCNILGFELVEDTALTPHQRWVLVAPPGTPSTRLLLAEAATDEQRSALGNQTGGRVFLFLHTDDFWRDYTNYRGKGVQFQESPRVETYGTVVVFKDPFGNKWDLLQLAAPLT